ncbi:MAG: hypothetical protein HPY83_13670 [Anaerolineae bacterium]|nr:hypothetical protein [Anaerolineae bacterium]
MDGSKRAFLSSGGSLLMTALLSACMRSSRPSAEVTSANQPAAVTPRTLGAVPAGTRLLIFHTNDVMGYVDPCG